MEPKKTKITTRLELAAMFHDRIMAKVRVIVPISLEETHKAEDQAQVFATLAVVHADALLSRLKATKPARLELGGSSKTGAKG